jgi:hypothetical protein
MGTISGKAFQVNAIRMRDVCRSAAPSRGEIPSSYILASDMPPYKQDKRFHEREGFQVLSTAQEALRLILPPRSRFGQGSAGHRSACWIATTGPRAPHCR